MVGSVFFFLFGVIFLPRETGEEKRRTAVVETSLKGGQPFVSRREVKSPQSKCPRRRLLR